VKKSIQAAAERGLTLLGGNTPLGSIATASNALLDPFEEFCFPRLSVFSSGPDCFTCSQAVGIGTKTIPRETVLNII
jgi:hypothetical protein